MGDQYKLYKTFIDLYVSVHSSKPRKTAFEEGNSLWKRLKMDKSKVDQEIASLRSRLAKQKASLAGFWAGLPKEKSNTNDSSTAPDVLLIEKEKPANNNCDDSHQVDIVGGSDQEENEDSDQTRTQDKPRDKPVLTMVQKDLAKVNDEYVTLSALVERGLLSDDTKKRLDVLIKQRKALNKKKRRLVRDQKYQQQKRIELRAKLDEIAHENPGSGIALKRHTRKQTGRPKLEEDQIELRKTIVEILNPGSKADCRRRSAMLQAVMRVQDLHAELLKRGYELSKTSTYYR